MFPCDYLVLPEYRVDLEYRVSDIVDTELSCIEPITCDIESFQCIDDAIEPIVECHEENMYYDLNNLVCVDTPLEYCTGLKCWDIIE